MTNIPVVSVGKLESDLCDENWKRFSTEICDAFKNIGFVYLKDHGVSLEKTSETFNCGRQFFSLSKEEKEKHVETRFKGHGYVGPEREILSAEPNHPRFELRESFDVIDFNGKFPDREFPNFKNVILSFITDCKVLVDKILVALALGLNLDRNYFTEIHKYIFQGANNTIFRLLHYPPVPPDMQPGAVRCGAHSDYGTLTLLFQDEIGGLEVQNAKGNWIKADPIPGHILVNVGDLLETWTSGKFPATIHRVLIPAEEIEKRCIRRSMAFFVHPDSHVFVSPLDGSPKFKGINADEHLQNRLNETYTY